MITSRLSDHYQRMIVRKFSGRRKPVGFLLIVFLVWQIALLFPPSHAQNQITLTRPLTVRWQYQSDRTVNLTPAVGNDHIYLPLAGGALVSLRVDGQFTWQTDTGGDFSAAPVTDERAVYVASEIKSPPDAPPPRATGLVRALGRTSGVTLWLSRLQKPLRGTLAANRQMLFGGGEDGCLYAFRKDTGQIAWTFQHGAPFDAHIITSNARLYIGSEDGTLLAIGQVTGKPLWRYRTRGALRGPVAVASGTVFFGSADGFVYAVDELTGRLRWQSRTGAGVQAVAATADGLIVASLDNFVYYFSGKGGERLWKRQLAGRIAAQPLVIGQSALFAPLSGDACVVLNLRDGKQINNLPVGEDNNTNASPVLASDILLVTTRRGLVAFAAPVTIPSGSTPRRKPTPWASD